MENSLLLGIETSTNYCSVALFENGRLMGSKLLTEEGSHSKMLTVLIQDLCQETQITLSDLQAISVSIGPGSYTGLRIGLSTAKGLCYGNDLPLIALPTLSILAEALRKKYPTQLICPMLDARRMEVYTSVVNAKREEIVPTQAKILDEEFLLEFDEPMIVRGNGSHKWEEMCRNKQVIFDKTNDYPLADFMGPMAHEAYLNKKFENLVTIEPAYLKEFMGTQAKK